MKNQTMTRRQLLSTAARSGLLVLGAGTALMACKGKSNAQAPKSKAAANGKCDVSNLTEAEKKTRTGMKYVDQTPIAAKRCDNCKLYRKGQGCNTCTVVKGPIAAAGYCIAWVKKA